MKDYVIEYALKFLIIVVVFGMVFFGSIAIWSSFHDVSDRLVVDGLMKV